MQPGPATITVTAKETEAGRTALALSVIQLTEEPALWRGGNVGFHSELGKSEPLRPVLGQWPVFLPSPWVQPA